MAWTIERPALPRLSLSRFALSRPALLRPAPIRHRLWQGGMLLAIFILTLSGANVLFLLSDRTKAVTSGMLGLDFLAFYTAGTLVRTGQFDKLYDLGVTTPFQHALAAREGLELGKSFAPFWNPPFYAWVFAPLSAMPYRIALATWTLLNVAALLGAITLLRHMLAPRMSRAWFTGAGSVPAAQDWRTWALVPLLVFVSMPFIQAISHAQNTFTSLLLVCLAVMFWRRNRRILAGLACGLLFYKPQLAACLAVGMVITMGPRVLIGIGAVGVSLLVTTLLTLPGTVGQFLSRVPKNLHFMQIENAYLWERHATLKAFWRLLIQGREAGEPFLLTTILWVGSIMLLGGAMLWTLRRIERSAASTPDDPWTGDTHAQHRDRAIAAVIVTSPLLMPFYFDYDLLLLAVPATLFAAEVLHRPTGVKLSRLDRAVVATWVVLFLDLLINPGLAGIIGVSPAVPLLTLLSILHILRAWGVRNFTLRAKHLDPIPVTIRRAAA